MTSPSSNTQGLFAALAAVQALKESLTGLPDEQEKPGERVTVDTTLNTTYSVGETKVCLTASANNELQTLSINDEYELCGADAQDFLLVMERVMAGVKKVV